MSNANGEKFSDEAMKLILNHDFHTELLNYSSPSASQFAGANSAILTFPWPTTIGSTQGQSHNGGGEQGKKDDDEESVGR